MISWRRTSPRWRWRASWVAAAPVPVQSEAEAGDRRTAACGAPGQECAGGAWQDSAPAGGPVLAVGVALAPADAGEGGKSARARARRWRRWGCGIILIKEATMHDAMPDPPGTGGDRPFR